MDIEFRVLITLITIASTISILLLMRSSLVTAYVFLWLFFPHGGQNLIGLSENLSQFSIMELTAAVSALLISFANSSNNKSENIFKLNYLSGSKILLILFIFAFVIQLCATLMLIWNPFDKYHSIPLKILSDFGSEFAAILFFILICRELRSIKQVESILLVFIWCGVALICNYFMVNFFSFTPAFITGYSFSEFGLFNSIFLNDYILVSIVGAVSSLSAFYFALNKKYKKFWIIIGFILSFLVFINLKRSVILSYCIGMLIFLITSRDFRKTLGPYIAVSSVLILSLGFYFWNILSELEFLSPYLLSRLGNLDSLDSLGVRYGIQMRAFDVIMWNFPFGVGPKMLGFYMGDSGVPVSAIGASDPDLIAGYFRVLKHGILTESHNGYIEQIASFGLAGFISMFALIFITLSRLVRNFSLKIKNTNLRALICAIIFFLGVFYYFLGYPRLYILIFFSIQALYILESNYTKSSYNFKNYKNVIL